MGVLNLFDALVDGEERAHGEDHQGHDEGPEIALSAVAEGMGFGWSSPSRAMTPEQETLIRGVRDRVHGLREQ